MKESALGSFTPSNETELSLPQVPQEILIPQMQPSSTTQISGDIYPIFSQNLLHDNVYCQSIITNNLPILLEGSISISTHSDMWKADERKEVKQEEEGINKLKEQEKELSINLKNLQEYIRKLELEEDEEGEKMQVLKPIPLTKKAIINPASVFFKANFGRNNLE